MEVLNITTDNYFTDLTLAEDFLKEKLTIIGTTRKNKKNLPKSLLYIKSRAVYYIITLTGLSIISITYKVLVGFYIDLK